MDFLNDVIALPDGGTLAVGSVEVAGAGTDLGVIRLTPEGFLDGTFGSGGSLTIGFDLGGDLDDYAAAAALQPDGKIVIAGAAQFSASGDFDYAVARLLPTGSLDATFGVGGKTTVFFDLGANLFDEALDVIVLDDGGILLVGGSIAATGSDCTVAKLQANGALDATFGTGGKMVVAIDLGGDLSDYCLTGLAQPDGKIAMAGYATTAGGRRMLATRLNADGSLDSSFDSDGARVFDFGSGAPDIARGIARLGTGELVIAGDVGSPSAIGVARVTAAGVLDPSFAGDGTVVLAPSVASDNVGELLARPDRRIVVVGSSPLNGSRDFIAIQLLDDGDLDGSFGAGGVQVVPFDLGGNNSDSGNAAALRDSGEIVVGGSVTAASFEFGVAQLLGPNLFSDDFESGDLAAWSAVVP